MILYDLYLHWIFLTLLSELLGMLITHNLVIFRVNHDEFGVDRGNSQRSIDFEWVCCVVRVLELFFERVYQERQKDSWHERCLRC